MDDGDSDPNVPMARCARECEAGYTTPLALQRIPALLALEVQDNGKTSLDQRPSGSDLEDGHGEPLVRRGAHRQRIEAETGDPGLTPDRREIPVQRRSPARAGSQTALADLRPESCQSDRGVRLLRRDHGDFPHPYVFVIIELGTRRILHQNVTAQPTAEWTLQQFRGALPGDHPYRFVITTGTASSRSNWTRE